MSTHAKTKGGTGSSTGKKRGNKKVQSVQGIEDSPRGNVLSAAAALFRDKGYERTTVRDIAAQVGIQSGSLFHHFSSKEDILLAVMEDVIRFNTGRLRDAVAVCSSDVEKLHALIRQELQFSIGDTSEAMTVMITEWRCLSPARQARALALREVYESIWLEVLTPLAEQGCFNCSAFIMRRLITGMVTWTPNWYRPKGSISLDELAEVILERVVGPGRAQARHQRANA